MGKGNRVRNERAESVLATAGSAKTPAKKSGKGVPAWVLTTIVLVILLAAVIFVVVDCMNDSGVFLRMQTVVETENFEVNVPMMSYMVASQRDYLVNLYSQWGTGIQIGGGTGGSALNTSAPLKDQIYSQTTDSVTGETVTKTWLEYFYDQALEQVIEVLACCEEARALGLDLSEEDYQNIELQLDYLDAYGELYGYSSDAFFALQYGKGVCRDDVEDMMILVKLASIYTNHKSDGYEAAIKNDPDRINEYYDKNQETYEIYIDYVGYTFTASFKPSSEKDADKAKAENEKLAEAYKAAQEKYKGYMEQLAACKNADEYLNKLYELVLQNEKDKIMESKGADYTLTEDDVKKCDETARAAQEKATVTNYKKPTGALTGFASWLFESKTEGEGDNKKTIYIREKGDVGSKADATDVVTTGDNAYKAVSSTYASGVMLETMHRNEEEVRSVGHILFDKSLDGLTSTDKLSGDLKTLADKVLKRDGVISAEAVAKEFIEMLKEEGALSTKTKADGTTYLSGNEELFGTYGEQYTSDSSVFYYGVAPGEMVTEFNDWMFDNSRVEGEVSYVKTEYGYHVMYYVGDECESWFYEIRNTLINEDLEKDIDAAIAKHKSEGGSMEIADKAGVLDNMEL